MITGEFYLQGVMEVGSGFRFNADSTFDFFFIYGAVDRFGKGTFQQQGDSLILHSPPKPERDFVLQSEKATADDKIVIRISDPNPMILPYIVCRVKTPDGILEGQCDQQGYIVLDKAPVQAISLVHAFFAERFSVFNIAQPEHNLFEFTIDPRIVEVEFNGIVLHYQDGVLSGRHPLLDPMKEYRFVKNN